MELEGLWPFIRFVSSDQPCDEDRPARMHIPDSVRVAVLVRDGGRCRKCRSLTNLEVDHLIPTSKGGNSETSPVCRLCVADVIGASEKRLPQSDRIIAFSFLAAGRDQVSARYSRRRPGAKGGDPRRSGRSR